MLSPVAGEGFIERPMGKVLQLSERLPDGDGGDNDMTATLPRQCITR
jgi:hypothetical protein